MANTSVQTVIDAAFARSTLGDPSKLAVDGEMIGALNRVYQTLYAARAMSSPAAHTTSAVLTGVASVYPLPVDIIDIRKILGLTGTVAAGSKINLIQIEEIERTTLHLAPCMYRTGLNLTSRGAAGDPGATDTITLFHIDAPSPLTALANLLDARSPVRDHELLVVQMACYLSAKDANRSPNDWSKILEERNLLLQMFVQETGASTTALTTPFGGAIKQRLDSIFAGTGTAPTQ